MSRRTIVFDCDGTLVDSEPLARRAWARELDARGHTLTDAEYLAVLGSPYPRTHAFFSERVELPPPAEFAATIGDAMATLIDAELRPFADAVETIEALRAGGARLGLATSSVRSRLDRTLERVGLTGVFEVTVAGDEIEHGKPAPDIYLAAADRLGIDPAQCLAVEDTATGVASARAAGMTVVAIAREPGDHERLAAAHRILDRLSAEAVLDALS